MRVRAGLKVARQAGWDASQSVHLGAEGGGETEGPAVW